MGSKSDYLENQVLDTYLATAYLAIFTTDPTDAAVGTEVSTGGYARQLCAFDAASAGATANTAAETFAASGAAWGTITHWAVYDALTVGNMLYHGALTAAKVVGDGDSLVFAAGAIDITED